MAYIGYQPTVGSFARIDDISPLFDGTTTTFNILVGSVARNGGSPQNLFISLDGVIQDPSSYTVSVATITFSEAPVAGTLFFGTILGSVYNITSYSDTTITPSKLDYSGANALNFRTSLGIQNGGVNGQWTFPTGTTLNRPTGVVGGTRFNLSTDKPEVYTANAGWSSMGGGAAGTGPDAGFFENDELITGSYTVGQSAMVSGVTVTIASPGVFNLSNHGLNIGQPIRFTTTGALPTGLTVNNQYFVIATGYGTNTFQVSTTASGTGIITTGTQSGVHSVGKSKNAGMFGSLNVAAGQTVTVPSGSSVMVVGTGGSANNVYPALAGNNAWTGLQTFSQPVIVQSVPAFSVYGTAQTITAGIGFVAVICTTETLDATSAHDTSTGRFTPQVAGYYQMNGSVSFASTAGVANKAAALLKNGSTMIAAMGFSTGDTNPWENPSASGVVYLNGSTDYVILGAQCLTTSGALSGANFSGVLVTRTS